MLAYLEGEIKARGPNFVIVVNRCQEGYLVYVPLRIRSAKKASLFIYHYQTEKSEALYGFATFKERELFERLIKISGLGPKGALALLSLYDPSSLLKFINSGNVAKLKSAPGVGERTARKIVAELSGVEVLPKSDDKLVEALEGLGFSRREAQESLQFLTGKEKSLEEKIRCILKEKGKNA